MDNPLIFHKFICSVQFMAGKKYTLKKERQITQIYKQKKETKGM